MTTISEPAVGLYSLLPLKRASYRWIGPASSRSRALPCGSPSTISTRTTSASSFSTVYWATEAPTLPAPTTVTFGRIFPSRGSGFTVHSSLVPGLRSAHVFDDGICKLGALQLGGTLHQPSKIIGHALLLDGLLEPMVDAVGRRLPAQVLEHHGPGEDDRAGVHLVLARVFRGGAVGRLKERRRDPDVGPRRDPEPPHLRRGGVREVIPIEVGGREDVVLVGPGEDLLEHAVRDPVLDHHHPLG